MPNLEEMANRKIIFDGGNTTELEYFFFYFEFENVTTLELSDEKLAHTLFSHLRRRALKYYFKTFTTNGVLLCKGKSYETVKRKPITEFATRKDLQRAIEVALSIQLKAEQLISDITEEVKNAHLQAEFTAKEKFVFLSKALLFNEQIQSFVLLHASTKFEEHQKVLIT